MATKKDFIPAAERLKEVGERIGVDVITFHDCVNAVANSFAGNNHRFDAEQFRNAAGYYNVKNRGND